jgi:hypothetical protein
MDLFVSEQDEKADMDTKVKSLLVNLSSISFTLIVLAEGIWSLKEERVELAIPFLSLSFILAISHLYLRKFNSVLHQNYLLSALFITCGFFILFGGNTGIGIVWAFLFPFFATALRGRKTGTYWSLALAMVIIIHIYLLQEVRRGSHFRKIALRRPDTPVAGRPAVLGREHSRHPSGGPRASQPSSAVAARCGRRSAGAWATGPR